MCSILIPVSRNNGQKPQSRLPGSKAALRKLKLYVRTALNGTGFQMSRSGPPA
jgi:hypothetical protein